MQRTIYIDILFCVNFVIDYIILLTVRRFMNLHARRLRLVLGAAVGGLCSFVILLPAMPSGFSMVLSLAFACFIVGTSFAPMPRVLYLKTAAAFFLISFGYCGVMLAVLLLFSPDSLIIRNSSVYIDISPMVLIVTTVFCYVIMRTILRVTGRGETKQTQCRLRITMEGSTVECRALIDTGSRLTEPFSGEPVIILSPGLLPEGEHRGLRLVPYSGIGGQGMLRAYRPDRMVLATGEGEQPLEGFVATGKDELADGVQAIVPAQAVL